MPTVYFSEFKGKKSIDCSKNLKNLKINFVLLIEKVKNYFIAAHYILEILKYY